ncbi:MAG: hypothetical protein EXR00_03510 [Alphaproteobacteria bacterium]|nr:hypothetical protein [Alphaproteobacteria bacterium]
MSNLLSDSQAASAWAKETIARQPTNGAFRDFVSGVIWSDAERLTDGKIIPLDPSWLSEIKGDGFPLLLNHDPGRPIGKVIAAEMFTTMDGRKFVAGILGFYKVGEHKSFSDFGFDKSLNLPPPNTLPSISKEMWIDLATDPREVEAEWVAGTAAGAPLPVKKRPLSHNALEATQELIRVGLPYLILVWNPFVTAIA